MGKESRLRSLSLFSGIGGFDLGFQRAGIDAVSACEIDENSQSVLKRHFKNSELFDDVRKVGRKTHEKGSIDLICGGFPCQDLSVAGKRAGLTGERSGLWFEFARVIDEIEPQWVVIENVPGLLSSNKGRDFAVIIQWLAQRGYGVVWRVLDAQYFGVPQRRRRVFIVASLRNGSAAQILFESESSFRDSSKSRQAGKEIAYTLRSNPSHSGDKGDGGINTTMVAQPFHDVVPVVFQQNMRDEVRLFGGNGQVAGALASQPGMKQQNYIAFIDGTIPEVMATGQANAEITKNISLSLTENHEQPIISNMVGVRRLTPIECERLQGFPDNWTDGQSDTVRYRQLGNAVAVPVAEWIGKRIMKTSQNHDE